MLSCQLIHVLFEAWLRACTAFFPAPHLWKSLRELCLHWRHHHCLAEEWSRLMYSLTFKVVCHLFSPRYLDHLQVQLEEDSDYSLILQSVPSASLVQCWFRMLHTIGNPVELSYITTFSSLPAFQKVASESGDQFAALPHDLPLIFHEAMKGVARMVYLFLGQEPQKKEESQPSVDTSSPATPISATPLSHEPKEQPREDHWFWWWTCDEAQDQYLSVVRPIPQGPPHPSHDPSHSPSNH